MFEQLHLLELFFCICFSAFGGVINRLVEKERHPKRKIKFQSYFIAALISSFVGIVVYFMCLYLKLQLELIAAATAISGFIGTPVLNLIFKVAIQRIGVIEEGGEPDGSKK